jgi:methylmalonyl-CoA mutase C-terminal domain/subunit
MVVAAARDEDVDAVGLSMLSGAHLALAPPVVAGLRAEGLDTPVVVGGIVPDQDLAVLRDAGVAEVIGPGATAEEVVAAMDRAIAGRGA